MLSPLIISELQFKTSRSGGAGGQNVNKVETKVQLLFDVQKSQVLTDEQKLQLQEKLANRISKDGILSLSSDATRSQLANKEKVVTRFMDLIQHALQPENVRKKTKIPDSVKLERLLKKKQNSEKKASRNWDKS
ncbi:MAG: aminoacyl-tRNA hydrolase [Flavobacteriaceae bacterium]|nr:aminoacyl-tRNA hydrolase [Flavobacteriaceae bacterium]